MLRCGSLAIAVTWWIPEILSIPSDLLLFLVEEIGIGAQSRTVLFGLIYAGAASSTFFSCLRKLSSGGLTWSAWVQDMQWGPSFTMTSWAPWTSFAVRCPAAENGTIRSA